MKPRTLTHRPTKNFLNTRKHILPAERLFSKLFEREKFLEKVSEVLAKPVELSS